MPSFIQSILSFFLAPLPPETMGFDSWGAIIDPYLNQSIDLVLHHFVTAASKSDNAESFLDKLTVDWMSVYKDPDPPQHEYIIISTKDSENDKKRTFILHRTVQKVDRDSEQPRAQGTTSTNENSNTQARTYHRLEGFLNLLSPSRPGTPLSSMEEGQLISRSTSTSTSTLYPPVLFPGPQHSIGDVLSLSATRASQVVSDSLDKDDNIRMKALDQILGENFIFHSLYGKGQKAREIQPNSLTFF